MWVTRVDTTLQDIIPTVVINACKGALLPNVSWFLQVLKLYHPLCLRWFLTSTHYRAPVNYSDKVYVW